jgi:hypothetical protein
MSAFRTKPLQTLSAIFGDNRSFMAGAGKVAERVTGIAENDGNEFDFVGHCSTQQITGNEAGDFAQRW